MRLYSHESSGSRKPEAWRTSSKIDTIKRISEICVNYVHLGEVSQVIKYITGPVEMYTVRQ